MVMPKKYDAKEAEPRLQKEWETKALYKYDKTSDKDVYSIDTPPPTISGNIHMGHAYSYTHQDFMARFHRMRGKEVFYPFGFDDNGLATERLVERELGIKAKEMPREEFIKRCLEVSKKYRDMFKVFWSQLGLSVDWTLLYSTIDEWVRKTSQRSFLELFRKGREYQKEAPTMWCPECQTAIAQVELEDKELASQFNDIVFRLEDGTELIIATTRPELLPACVAVFAHPDDKRYQPLFGKKARVPLFDYYVPILPDKRADPEKGTGLVMCCTFGDQTDMEWYFAHNLPLKIAITEDGRMNREAGKYEGETIKGARQNIINDLEEADLLKSKEPISHAVNVHERCGTEIEFLVTKQWFIRYLDLKAEFKKRGAELNWYPKHMKVRFDNWIDGLQWDWCISRQRHFGVPFPVWYCNQCDAVIVANDDELPVDPLRDDPPVGKCPDCGGSEFKPEEDVLDTWATSSLTPQINARWKDDDEEFEKLFPMDLRPQAHDIITFWLFNTVVKAHLHNDDIPWKDVMISGHGLDPHGKKMSKSKGNVVDPREVLENYPADAMRFWAAGSKLGEDMPYQEKDLVTGNKTITKIWNASRFCNLFIEDYEPEEVPLELMDRHLMSKLNRLVKEVTGAMEKYDYARLRSETEKLFWNLFCDNYLEIVKDRVYNEARGAKAKKSAQYTLYTGLLTFLKLYAPIMPHITEEVYTHMFAKKEGKKSIHVSRWPKHDDELIDVAIEKVGDVVIGVVGDVRRFKSEQALSLKEELARITIASKLTAAQCAELKDEIKGVTNAQQVIFRQLDELSHKDYELEIER